MAIILILLVHGGKHVMNDKKEKKDELEGIGHMFYGIGWVEALLILGYAFAPVLVKLLLKLI